LFLNTILETWKCFPFAFGKAEADMALCASCLVPSSFLKSAETWAVSEIMAFLLIPEPN
jgi:hypothetical protein